MCHDSPLSVHHHDHYSDAIMSTIASQITSVSIVYLTVYSGPDQRKHQSSTLLSFLRGILRWPMASPHKGPATGKMFPFDDVIMWMLGGIPSSISHCPRDDAFSWLRVTPRTLRLTAVIHVILFSRENRQLRCFNGKNLDSRQTSDKAAGYRNWTIRSQMRLPVTLHNSDVIMSAMVSQITGVTIVLFNRLFGCRSKKASKLRVTALCGGNSPVNSRRKGQ